MNAHWSGNLTHNPLPALLDWPDEALNYFTSRDLMGEKVKSVQALWELPEAARLVHKQREDGSWKHAGKTIDSETGQNYFLLETFRSLRLLVEMYRFDFTHHSLQRAAEYVLSCQTEEGDIRGILGNQYMPYYHGAILEPLAKAGFGNDPRVIRGLDWLLSVRQEDGGWIVPTQAVPWKERTKAFWRGPAVTADRSLPHAHMATGMALRALAAHPGYRRKPEVIAAGEALKSRFLQPDKYNDRKAISYWLKFQYPFWWANLLTGLDTLGRIGFGREDEDVARGLAWFVENQERDGLWPTGYGSGSKAESNRRWVGLAVCRVFKMFCSGV